jgi:hypothetical protein
MTTSIVEQSANGALAPRSGEALQPTPSIESILHHAVTSGASADTMKEIVALCRSVRADKAKEAFSRAKSEFKATCPPIPRRTPNAQFKKTLRDGTQVPRLYASLEDIASTIDRPLAACGLSYRWGDSELVDGKIRLACIVAHLDGHEESASVLMDTTSAPGSAGPQQKSAIIETYAMRYSLIKVLGLTTADEDADGNTPDNSGETITQDEADEISILLAEANSDKVRFLKWAGVASINDIPAKRYAEVVRAIKASKAAKKGGAS